MSYLFDGSAVACLADFRDRFPDEESWHLLAEFTGWKNIQLGTKAAERVRPQGERLLRLEVFLDLIGYKVTEFCRLDPVFKQLARAIAIEMTTLDVIAETLDYADRKQLLTVLLRGKGMTNLRVHRLRKYVDSTAGELKARLAELRESLSRTFPVPDLAPVADALPTVGHSTQAPKVTRQRVRHSRPAPRAGIRKTVPAPLVSCKPDEFDHEAATLALAYQLHSASTMLQLLQRYDSPGVQTFLSAFLEADRIQLLSQALDSLKGKVTHNVSMNGSLKP